jgi:Flp pilus assembly protein TadG
MIRALTRLSRSRSGATAAEFTLVLPLFLMFVFAFFSIGGIYWANAGLTHGIGEGARVATLFPRRSNAEIQAAIQNNSFGVGSIMSMPTITAGTANAQDFVDIQATVSPEFDLLFIDVAPVTITERRRAYRPA